MTRQTTDPSPDRAAAGVSYAEAPLRAPAQVMRLSRLGSLHQCRLSFMRQLTRRMALEGWHFTRTAFEVDASGVGHAVYTATGPDRSYSLVAFAHDLPDHLRSDRVIAEAWTRPLPFLTGCRARKTSRACRATCRCKRQVA